MAARIRAEDVQEVKERTALDEVVREHVTLRPAGPGSFKGLCPFHDEKTPSFTVRPAMGTWHCFGCGEGGDAIAFVTQIDHLSFVEAVERLAARAGMELRYEDDGGRGGGREPGGLGKRARLVEANRTAAEFYEEALHSSPEAVAGRAFLHEKGFSAEDARVFGVGFAPRSGTALAQHLRAKGFTEEELVTAGLVGRNARGAYDRFRGRVIWPIRDITGDPVGFGARRLFDDDRIAAKYLNTSETPLYRKTSVLYGLDLAKKAMAGERRAVVVEGYTDVMACHLSGVGTAVATCGTAFGADHIKTLRRILRDEADRAPARVVFTFDGDAAGQAAAMKAFGDDQQWASQSYVAVAPRGQDPNDLRTEEGDDAVRDLIEGAVPMFEFAVRTTIGRFDLDHAEGRVAAMRAAAPIVAGIRDRALRPEYTRTVAGWIGVEVDAVGAEVARAARAPRQSAPQRVAAPERGRPASVPEDGEAAGEPQEPRLPWPDLRDPRVRLERMFLQATLQYPGLMPDEEWAVASEGVTAPAHVAVVEALRTAGGPLGATAVSHAAWAASVLESAREQVRPLVRELGVDQLPTVLDPSTGTPTRRYIESLVWRVQETLVQRRIADAMSVLRRTEGASAGTARGPAHDEGAQAVRAASERLTTLHRELARVRARME